MGSVEDYIKHVNARKNIKIELDSSIVALFCLVVNKMEAEYALANFRIEKGEDPLVVFPECVDKVIGTLTETLRDIPPFSHFSDEVLESLFRPIKSIEGREQLC